VNGYRNLSVRRLMINRRDIDPLRVGLFDGGDGYDRRGMHRCSSYQLLRRIDFEIVHLPRDSSCTMMIQRAVSSLLR